VIVLHIARGSLLFIEPFTGGTDICSLFAGMCSALPVYRGEIQCRMLGMAIEAFNSNGTPNPPDQPGDLVCTRPFPCMPAGFWPLSGYGTEEAVKAAEERYQKAYFSEFDGVWCKLDMTTMCYALTDNPWYKTMVITFLSRHRRKEMEEES
jgi:acyl-coenzyme A synthetase/AMP-(fatty) acid ligase